MSEGRMASGAGRLPDSRYDFGRNSSELAGRLEQRHLDEAKRDLERLVGDVRGRSFLDVGCGSGLHSAAALALGARSVRAFDYDPLSVGATREVLGRFMAFADWRVRRADILEPQTLPAERFDVVYCWGVLHHTGDVWGGVRNAAALVAPGGRLCLALYMKTPLCPLWKMEKRLYAGNKWLRPAIKWSYVRLFLLARQLRTHDARAYVRDYSKGRGMDFLADVDDWLGGYPYESVCPEELEAKVAALGFSVAARFGLEAGSGIFGTRCGEWRFERGS